MPVLMMPRIMMIRRLLILMASRRMWSGLQCSRSPLFPRKFESSASSVHSIEGGSFCFR